MLAAGGKSRMNSVLIFTAAEAVSLAMPRQ